MLSSSTVQTLIRPGSLQETVSGTGGKVMNGSTKGAGAILFASQARKAAPSKFQPMISPATTRMPVVTPQNPLQTQQQQQIAYVSMMGKYGGKRKIKKVDKMEKKKKKKDKEEEWDEGFGELYENIEDRKVKKLFPTLDDIHTGIKKKK